MSFADDIKRHLEHVEQTGIWVPAPESTEADAAYWRQRLVALLARVENERWGGRESIQRLHDNWKTDDRVVRFVRLLARELRAGMARNANDDQLRTMIGIALSRQLDLPDALPTFAEQIELDAAADHVRVSVGTDTDDHWEDVPCYAREIGVVIKASDGRGRVSSAGKVLLEVAGRDSVRWLLHLEAAQAIGPSDPWRLSAETAKALCAEPDCIRDEQEWQCEPGDTNADSRWSTIRRLDRFGVLEYVYRTGEPGGRFGYRVHPIGLTLLREIASETETPFRVLAATLLQDQSNRTLTRADTTLAATLHQSVAAAGVRHARMVAHEVRNALMPVQVAFESLYRDIRQPEARVVLEQYRPRIQGGLDRTFSFVKEQLNTLTLPEEPTMLFDPGAALAEAIDAMRGAIELVLAEPPRDLPPVRGHRSRFVLAIVNLLRNSVQAKDDGRPRIRLQVTVQDEGRKIVTTLEDDGPGISEQYREAIFSDGFSLRPGGSGHGLALVRTVIQDEMHGEVRVIPAPLGGASFLVVLPVTQNGDKGRP